MLIKTSKAKGNFADSKFQNILRPFHALPNVLSPQVKRCSTITYKHEIYQFVNELRLAILEN